MADIGELVIFIWDEAEVLIILVIWDYMFEYLLRFLRLFAPA